MSRLTMAVQKWVDEQAKKTPTPSRSERKSKKQTARALIVTTVRPRVFALDLACICGRCNPATTDEMHEVVSRAQLRGQPPEVIFCVENCVRLSRRCHRLVTGELGVGKALTIRFLDPIKRAMGPIELAEAGRTWIYQRGVRP